MCRARKVRDKNCQKPKFRQKGLKMLRSKGYKMGKLARIALLSIMFICVNASEYETQGVYKYEYDKNGNVIAENKSDLEGELLEKIRIQMLQIRLKWKSD